MDVDHGAISKCRIIATDYFESNFAFVVIGF